VDASWAGLGLDLGGPSKVSSRQGFDCLVEFVKGGSHLSVQSATLVSTQADSCSIGSSRHLNDKKHRRVLDLLWVC